jgi:hypothetical protein
VRSLADLLQWAPPDGVELLCAWLAVLAECRTERPADAVLPFITVRRSGGGDDDLTDTGRYAVSVFHGTEAEAMAFGRTVHRRMKLFRADNVRTIESFRPEYYGAEPAVSRIRAIYEVPLRYQYAASPQPL